MGWIDLKKMDGFKERWKFLTYHAKAYIHGMIYRQLSNMHAANQDAGGVFTQHERERNALDMSNNLHRTAGMDDARYIEHAAEDLKVTRMEEQWTTGAFIERVKKIIRNHELMEEGNIANAIRERQAQMDEGDPEAEEAAREMEKEAIENSGQDYAIRTTDRNPNNGERGNNGNAGAGLIPRTRSRSLSPPRRATERNDGRLGGVTPLTPPYRPVYR